MKLLISQIILERVVFGHRENYLSVPTDTPLATSRVTMKSQVQRAEGDPNSAALVRLTAESDEGSTYQFAVTFTVLFTMDWTDAPPTPEDLDNLDKRLMVTGSTMLFPYARELVSSLSGRGKFGPSWLAPTSFNNLEPTPVPPEPAGVSGL